MKNINNMYIIDYVFSNGNRMKYVINRKSYYEAKNEAEDARISWNNSENQMKINDFLIKEIKNEIYKKQKSPDNSRHSSKSKVRKQDFDEDEEFN